MNGFADGSPEQVLSVDARGLYCPVPLLRLKRRVRDAPAGARLVLRATDPSVLRDVPAFCREEGHEYLGDVRCEDGTIELTLRTRR